MKKVSYFPLLILLGLAITIQLFVATIILFKLFNFPVVENSYLSQLSDFDLVNFLQHFSFLLVLLSLWYIPIFLLLIAISIRFRKIVKYIPIITTVYATFAFTIVLASTMTEEIFTLCISVASLFALVMSIFYNLIHFDKKVSEKDNPDVK